MPSCPGSFQSMDDFKEIKPIVFKIGLSVATHPIEYAKVLIQIGHEPIAPRPCKTLFRRKPSLLLPSVFQYMGHIRRQDGILGLYRGISPKIVELCLTKLASEKVSELWPKDPLASKSEEELTEEEWRERCINSTVKECAQKLAGIIISQPFHVLSIRCMAQFVGGEDKYSGLFGGIRSVLDENGISGFWSGLIPRIIGEMSMVGLSASLTYVVNNYLVKDKELKDYTALIVNFFASSICYPFQVVSNCMVVSRSGLIAGYPPCMPLYTSWIDCWDHLSKNNQLRRGSSVLFRYYTGPKVVVGDRALPINPSMFIKNK